MQPSGLGQDNFTLSYQNLKLSVLEVNNLYFILKPTAKFKTNRKKQLR